MIIERAQPRQARPHPLSCEPFNDLEQAAAGHLRRSHDLQKRCATARHEAGLQPRTGRTVDIPVVGTPVADLELRNGFPPRRWHEQPALSVLRSFFIQRLASQVRHAVPEVLLPRRRLSTSLQDLLNCAGPSKSSLYESFGSKRPLSETCLKSYREERVARIMQRLPVAKSGLAFIGESGTAGRCGHLGVPGRVPPGRQSGASGRRHTQAEGCASSGSVHRHQYGSGLQTLANAGTPPKTLRSIARTVVQAIQT